MYICNSRYTTDSISSIAFGFNCRSLENPDSDFKRYGSMAFSLNPIKNAVGLFSPIILDILRIPLMHMDVIKFFTTTFQNMVNYRRENDIVRKDFFNLLMQLMDKGVLEDDESSEKINDSTSGNKYNMYFISLLNPPN